jgi:hypothetical protein
MRWTLTLLSILALPALAGGAQPGAAAAPALTVVDATAGFWTFWDTAATLPEAQRIQRFCDLVVVPHPEFYAADVLDKMALDPGSCDTDPAGIVGRYLRDVVPYVPRMRAISATVRAQFDEFAADFGRTFPDFAPSSPVVFTVSLFSFDGATRTIGGHTVLLFGIDGIARFHAPNANLKVLFDHELFHQYHDQILPGPPDDSRPLWMALWEEGLATYVSGRMNPQSTESDVLLSDSLGAAARPVLPMLARELSKNLDSVDNDEYAAFFYANNARKDLPPRGGYYVGYQVARSLAAGRSLQEMARLHGPELEAAIRAALEKLGAS